MNKNNLIISLIIDYLQKENMIQFISFEIIIMTIIFNGFVLMSRYLQENSAINDYSITSFSTSIKVFTLST